MRGKRWKEKELRKEWSKPVAAFVIHNSGEEAGAEGPWAGLLVVGSKVGKFWPGKRSVQ